MPAGPINVSVAPDGSAALVTVTRAASAAFIRIKKTSTVYAKIGPSSPVTVGTPVSGVPGQTPAEAAAAITAPSSPAPVYTAPASNYVPQPFGKLATVYTGKGPSAEAITPDGRYLYVINTQASTLSIINIANDEVVKTIKVGNYPSAVKISPDGHYCFVVNSGSNTVTIISTGNYY